MSIEAFLLCVDLFTFSPPFSSDLIKKNSKGRGGGAVREDNGIGMPLGRLKASRRGREKVARSAGQLAEASSGSF